MHPCPHCGSDYLTIAETRTSRRRIVLERVETTPPEYDYRERDEEMMESTIHQVWCDTCAGAFVFDLDAFQISHPQGMDPNPYDHASSPNGCHEDCAACAWDAAHLPREGA
jgi:hypothetical protein